MSLRVLTLNIWGLPWPVGRDVLARSAAIGDALPGMALDVAAFQEVWTPAAHVALAESGRRAGLAHVFPASQGPGCGGLLLLSRHPLRGARFFPYTLNGFPERIDHADYWGGKGYVRCEIGTPEGPVAFVTTHLHASYAPRPRDPYVGHRTAQVVQLAAALRGVSRPLVAVGDFNFEERFEEYAVLAGLTGVEDVARVLERRQETVRWEGSHRHVPGEPGRRIDYVFVRSGGEASLRPHAIERVLDGLAPIDGRAANYSDHAGLLVELELAAGGGAPPPVDPAAVALARSLLAAGRRTAKGRRGRLRWSGAGGLAAASLAVAPALRSRLSRRQFLGAGVASLAGLAGGGCLFLAQEVRPAELDAFDATLRELDALAPPAVMADVRSEGRRG